MIPNLTAADTAKFVCAERAARLVETGMRVGLGTGSTAAWLVRCLGAMKKHDGLDIQAVATSLQTAQLAAEVGIEVVSLDDAKWLDLTIDGADEFDDAFTLIKGGGGALLREKIVARASDRMVVIADSSKQVAHLGAFPLPIEVIPFGWRTTQKIVENCIASAGHGGADISLRMNGAAPFVTDEGNHILDLRLGAIGDARHLALALNEIPGVVENGLFVGISNTVVLGFEDGHAEVRDVAKGVLEREQIDLAQRLAWLDHDVG